MDGFAQGYPLWLAEVDGGHTRAGRVVGWLLSDNGGGGAVPLVAFTGPDGRLLETAPPRGTDVFLGDSRAEVLGAAVRVDEPPAAGFAPPPGDEPDPDEPPARRPRVQVHRMTLADLDDPADATADRLARGTRQFGNH